MQDRQIQVRAGSARAVGKLRETDGMMMGRRDATAQWASACIIQPEEVSIAAESWPSWTATLSVSTLNLLLTAFSLGSFQLSSPLLGKSFTKLGRGCCQPAPTTQNKGGGGARLIIHLFCPSSLSESMLPSLFAPLSLTTFNFIHSLIPPLTHLPPQHPSHLTSPSHHHTRGQKCPSAMKTFHHSKKWTSRVRTLDKNAPNHF